MAEQKNQNEHLNVEDALTQSEAFLIKYKNAIIGGVVAVIIIVAGFIMYKNLYADKADNNSLSPIFLMQAGEILVKQGKYDDAVNAYTKIKDKYFQSYQAMDIDKYIEQAKLMKK